MKRVYVVRHGQTVGNKDNTFQFPDTELSEAGHRGAAALAKRCATLPIEVIYASPMMRAKQTAQYVADELNLPVQILQSAGERSMPFALRGVKKDSPEGVLFLDSYDNLYRQTQDLPEGFENVYMVLERIKQVTQEIETSTASEILLVSHAAFLHQFIGYLLLDKQEDVNLNITVANSITDLSNVGITEFRVAEGRWKLHMLNDKAHFAE